MAKNQGALYRPAKKGDSFFTGPKRKFDLKNRKFQSDAQNSGDQRSIRPSQSGGSDFFRKSIDKLPEKLTVKKNEEQTSTEPKREKKPFDKKKYRLQKYSMKYKVQQWEQKRNTAVIRSYYRSLKEDEPKLNVKAIYEQYKDEIDSDKDDANDKINEENENNLNASINQASVITNANDSVARNSKEKKNKAFKKAYREFQRIKEEKKQKKEEMLKRKAEREKALQAYKKTKAEKFKKLSRKTKRGQPIMKERMELLLEKIQNSMK